MRENVPEQLNWKFRDHRDGETGRARFRCFDLQVQECDGDFSNWHIKRGDQYVAMGETYDVNDEYHFDVAQRLARDTLVHLWRAVEMNEFVSVEMPRLKAEGLI